MALPHSMCQKLSKRHAREGSSDPVKVVSEAGQSLAPVPRCMLSRAGIDHTAARHASAWL